MWQECYVRKKINTKLTSFLNIILYIIIKLYPKALKFTIWKHSNVYITF